MPSIDLHLLCYGFTSFTKHLWSHHNFPWKQTSTMKCQSLFWTVASSWVWGVYFTWGECRIVFHGSFWCGFSSCIVILDVDIFGYQLGLSSDPIHLFVARPAFFCLLAALAASRCLAGLLWFSSGWKNVFHFRSLCRWQRLVGLVLPWSALCRWQRLIGPLVWLTSG